MGSAGTLRQRMERHRTDPTCASCHGRMDPLGFALENFDAIGGWRTAEASSRSIASGRLPAASSSGAGRAAGRAPVAAGCVRPLPRREDAHLRPRPRPRPRRPPRRGPDRRQARTATDTGSRRWCWPSSRAGRSSRADRRRQHHEERSGDLPADGPEGASGISIALPMLEAMDPDRLRGRIGRSAGHPPYAWHSSTSPTGSTCRTGPAARRAGLRSPADPGAAAGGQGRHPRPQRADLEPGAGPRRRRRRPRPGDGQLPDRPAPPEDRRGRPPAGVSVDQLAAQRSGAGHASPRWRSAAKGAGMPANATTAIAAPTSQPLLAGRIDPRCQAGQPATGLRPALRQSRAGRATRLPDDRRRKSVLDFVAEDARRLQQMLGDFRTAASWTST